jgi:hypothetical protein
MAQVSMRDFVKETGNCNDLQAGGNRICRAGSSIGKGRTNPRDTTGDNRLATNWCTTFSQVSPKAVKSRDTTTRLGMRRKFQTPSPDLEGHGSPSRVQLLSIPRARSCRMIVACVTRVAARGPDSALAHSCLEMNGQASELAESCKHG